jgi:fructose-bisphosphate aldolase class II
MADKAHYKQLGLVNTNDMFKKAMAGGYAIPAYNFNNMEQLQGIIIGCAESKSPVILQVSGSARKYADPTFLPYMAMGAVQMALTRQVVDYAHEREVTVEGELGVLAGVEDEVSHEVSHYTKPEEVEAFVEKTGVDSLAISIGTSHGAYKFKIKPGEEGTGPRPLFPNTSR